MSKWMKTYWKARHIVNFVTSTYQESQNQKNEYLYAKKIKDVEAIKKININGDPDYILSIENPSHELMFAALRKNGHLLCDFIERGWVVDEELQKAAVTEWDLCAGYCIGCIDNPSEEVQLAALQFNYDVIENIKNPTEKVQLKAVESHPKAIDFIKNPTDKVKEYVKKKWGARYWY